MTFTSNELEFHKISLYIIEYHFTTMRSVMKYISSDSMLFVLSNDVLIVVVSWLYPNGITELAVKLWYTVSLGGWSHAYFILRTYWCYFELICVLNEVASNGFQYLGRRDFHLT